MTVSYENLLNLADYVNATSIEDKSSISTYNVMFRDRSSRGDPNSVTVGPEDLEALLKALVGDTNFSWVGNNCSYKSTSCSVESESGVYGKIITPDIPGSQYSKCYINREVSYANKINNTHKTYDCTGLKKCGTDVDYYWDRDNLYHQAYDQSTGYTSSLKDIAKPGRCSKRYTSNTEGLDTTNDPDDPNKIGSANADGNWNCRPYGDVLAASAYPSAVRDAASSDGPNNYEKSTYQITRGNANMDNGIPINAECATNPINYGGIWQTELENGEYNNNPKLDANGNYIYNQGVNAGKTDPDAPSEWLIAGSSVESVDNPFVYGGQTKNCEIHKTIASYVKKGKYEEDDGHLVECEAHMPLYPGDVEAVNYDLPLDDSGTSIQTAAEWWNENSCIWVNSIMFGDAVNSADRYFYPQILNGECTYGDFTQENKNGPGFKKIVPLDGNGNNKQRCDGPDGISGNCEQINTSIKRDNLVNVLGDNIHEVGFTDIPTTPYGNETQCATESKCQWVGYWDGVKDNNNNPNKSSFNNTINSDIIGGHYKIYRKDKSTDRDYAKPCTYDVDTGKKIVLDGTLYRATNVQSTALDGSDNLCINFTAEAKETPMSFSLDNGQWYSKDEELIQNGSSIGGTTQVKKITKNGSHPTAHGSGHGSGECWQTITGITPPKYKNYNNLFHSAQSVGEDERNFQNYLSGKYDSSTSENVLQGIASSDNSDVIYVKKANDECGSLVHAGTQLQHAWVNPNQL